MLGISRGKLQHNVSTWQTTQRKLCYDVSILGYHKRDLELDLRAIRILRELFNNQIPVLLPPSPHRRV